VNSGEPLSTMPMRLPPFTGRAHLAEQVQQEEQRAVGHTRQAGAEAAVVALLLVLLADFLLDLLPLHAEGRVGEHVVELLASVAIVGGCCPSVMLLTSCPLMSMSALQMA
jgi:hypothetical protein